MAPAPAPADPKAALLTSLAGVQAGNYAFKIDSAQGGISGSVDWSSKSFAIDITSPADSEAGGATQIVAIGADTYTKTKVDPKTLTAAFNDGNPMPKELADYYALYDGKHWVHESEGSPTAGLFDTSSPDPLKVADELNRVQSVEAASSVSFSGTMKPDPTDKELAAALKKAGKTAVPFTATLDGQGRLIELDEDSPTAKQTMTLSGYGEQQPQEKPAGAQEIPASVQKLLKSSGGTR